jgi:hypothetical protein
LSFLDPSLILSYTIQAPTSHLLVLHGPIVRPYRCCPLPSHAIINVLNLLYHFVQFGHNLGNFQFRKIPKNQKNWETIKSGVRKK